MDQGDALRVDLGKAGTAEQLAHPTGCSLLLLKHGLKLQQVLTCLGVLAAA